MPLEYYKALGMLVVLDYDTYKGPSGINWDRRYKIQCSLQTCLDLLRILTKATTGCNFACTY